MKKITISSELIYLLGIIILSFSVAMIAAADFGVSMVVAPAYILSLKLKFLTFGQAEYIVQGIVFILFCLLMRRLKLVFFVSFATGLIYGAVLDLCRVIIPVFNPDVTVPGSMAMPIRIIFLAFGMILTSFSISLFFKTYLYPQVYDFFVKGIATHYKKNINKFKICFDFSCLAVSCIMTLSIFGRFNGVGVGTIIMTVFNGMIITFFGKVLDRFITVKPIAPKFAEFFDLSK